MLRRYDSSVFHTPDFCQHLITGHPRAPSAFAVASALTPTGAGVTAKVDGAAPFVEPERRFSMAARACSARTQQPKTALRFADLAPLAIGFRFDIYPDVTSSR